MDFILIEAKQIILMKFDCLGLSEAGAALIPWFGFVGVFLLFVWFFRFFGRFFVLFWFGFFSADCGVSLFKSEGNKKRQSIVSSALPTDFPLGRDFSSHASFTVC